MSRKRFAPRLLDLYSGAGGAAEGYRRAGFDVTGIDISPQPNYPSRFILADALEYLAEHADDYDIIHASPPCQSYLSLTHVNRALGRAPSHPDLIAPTRDALRASGKPYVIENVDGSPLIEPIKVCGTTFGLPLRRHRRFESNVPLVALPCDHERFSEPRYWTGWRPNGEHRLSTVVQVYGNAGGSEHWAEAMGIDWMTKRELIEAIPPAYTEFVGEQLMAWAWRRTA